MLLVKTFNMLICSERKENDVGKITAPDEEQRSMFVPDLNNPELDYDRAKLQLKINKQLFKIVKEIPHFNPKLNVLMISDLFESYIEKYDLSEEQKNKVFKLWVPIQISHKLSIPKFYYLDTGAVVRASMFNTLTEEACYIDKYRRHLVLQSSDPTNKHVIRQICQTKEADMKPHKKAYFYFCGKLGHLLRKCFIRRKSMKQFKIDKDSGIIQEQVQAKKLDAQNGHSQCPIDRPVCYKRPRTEDKRSYSLLMKTRNNY
ncbi:hypothetical protein XELAEV_18003658mg [Xenopus laevis]|uniref:Uncharacterized protein n=1 Tax=Xenopus laevis TaxID=8355 RepID=A0A974BQ19_XENLA|nr:hypothetical protein XELAEV_18003658mg [Xenopus laevis]